MYYVVDQYTTANRDHAKANAEFKKQFLDNKFGYVCSVCDRLWFKKDLRSVPRASIGLLAIEFPGEDVSKFIACNTCYKMLAKLKVPQLLRLNGFVYPEYPSHLPPLDIITERLLAPRNPFMQIRRL